MTAEILNSIIAKVFGIFGGSDSTGTYKRGLIEKLRNLFIKNRTAAPREVYDVIAQEKLPIEIEKELVRTIKEYVDLGNIGKSPEVINSIVKDFENRVKDPITVKAALSTLKRFTDNFLDSEGRAIIDPKDFYINNKFIGREEGLLTIDLMEDVLGSIIKQSSDTTAANLRALIGRTFGLGLGGALIGGTINAWGNIKKAAKAALGFEGQKTIDEVKKGYEPFKEGAKIGGLLGAGTGAVSVLKPILESSPTVQRTLSNIIASSNRISPSLSETISSNPAFVEPLATSLGSSLMQRRYTDDKKIPGVSSNIGKSTYSRLIDTLTKRQTKKKYTIEKVEK
jgi:uncharacterized protein YeeX (DUF496 family)